MGSFLCVFSPNIEMKRKSEGADNKSDVPMYKDEELHVTF